MCVTNVYVDRYPDGREVEFRQTSYCQYGQPGRPCQKLSVLENPVRNIQFHEPTTQFIMNQSAFPPTPPRSAGGSHHRRSMDNSSDEGRRRRKLPILKPTREHKKERIVIVEAPPTPRTPPQVYNQVFTAPNSPIVPPRIVDERRSRPIIVDERPLHRTPRAPSVPRRSLSPTRGGRIVWESPSTSHTSFDLRAELEREERDRERRRRRQLEREELEAAREEERRREERMRALDDEIRNRPTVPIPSMPRPRPHLRPVIDQSEALQNMMGGLRLDGRLGERVVVDAAAAERRRLEERNRILRQRIEEDEAEAQRQRLRERQLPRRRVTVGPGHRRHRVLYDDGVYRFE